MTNNTLQPTSGHRERPRLLDLGLAALIAAAGIIATGCASVAPSPGDEARRFDDFASGSFAFSSSASGGETFDGMRPILNSHFHSENWLALARGLLAIGYDQDLAYFYLAQAAEGLGFPDAAVHYYQAAISTRSKCASIENRCDGIDLPDAALTQIRQLRRGGSPNAARARPTNVLQSLLSSGSTHRPVGKPATQSTHETTQAYVAPLPASMEAPSSLPKLSAYALVIGNSSYSSFGTLPNPRNDARAIATELSRFGIGVDLVLDGDRNRLIKALNEYSQRAAGHDVNILFYAGHGIQVEGVNYVVPTDMRADGISAGYVKLAGISLQAALDYLPARTRIVFLDACRDNPAARSLALTRGAAGVGLAPVAVPGGTLIAFATRDGSTAEDGTGANSPYTSALLQHLQSPEDIGIVLRRVRESVLKATRNRQEPWEYGSLVGGQLVISRMAR